MSSLKLSIPSEWGFLHPTPLESRTVSSHWLTCGSDMVCHEAGVLTAQEVSLGL